MVVSYRYWQQEMSADQTAIGQDIAVNGTPFTVIGVMPPKFFGSELNEEAPDMWLPITAQPEVMLQPSLLNPHGLFWMHLMARLRDGVSPEQSQAWATTKLQQFMMAREGAQVSEKRQKEIGQIRIDMLPGGRGVSHLRAQFEQPLLILMGVVGLVLAIACANLANFILSKAASREREFSTRLALGATNVRIARQILTEALILSGIGGLLGLAVAFWGTHVLVAFVVAGAKHTAIDASPDLTVLAFTFGISLLTGILFGIAPSPAYLADRFRARAQRNSSNGSWNGRAKRPVVSEDPAGYAGRTFAGSANRRGAFCAHLAEPEESGPGFQPPQHSAARTECQAGGIQIGTTPRTIRAHPQPPQCAAGRYFRRAFGNTAHSRGELEFSDFCAGVYACAERRHLYADQPRFAGIFLNSRHPVVDADGPSAARTPRVRQKSWW